MKKCIILVGQTCSGKTTLIKEIENRGFKRVVTYTTRPKRPGEIDGVHYHFIHLDEFTEKVKQGFFAEYTSYNASFGFCMYGSAKEDYNSIENTVIILNPEGVMSVNEDSAYIVYLDIRESVLKDRAIKRGDSVIEISRRLASDKQLFNKMVESIPLDLTIQTELVVDYMADWIIDSFHDMNEQYRVENV